MKDEKRGADAPDKAPAQIELNSTTSYNSQPILSIDELKLAIGEAILHLYGPLLSPKELSFGWVCIERLLRDYIQDRNGRQTNG
jgi:hypothetical protein